MKCRESCARSCVLYVVVITTAQFATKHFAPKPKCKTISKDENTAKLARNALVQMATMTAWTESRSNIALTNPVLPVWEEDSVSVRLMVVAVVPLAVVPVLC